MALMEQRVIRAARLIRESADDEGDGEVPQALLDGLNEVVPGVGVCFSELDLTMRRVISFQMSESAFSDDGDDEDTFWRVYPELTPCHYQNDGTTVRYDVLKLSDFISDRALANTALYQDYLLPGGERYEMFVSLPTSLGRTRDFVFCRWDSDFTEADRDLLTLLRPHLNALYHDHQRRRAGIPSLTARQWQVLQGLAAGQSTEQIAAALYVSRSTVRKHLENIYERLGVSSQAAAIGRAFVAGPG